MSETANTKPGPLFYLIYTSKAKARMSQPALARILEQSRRNNMPSQITGLLLYMEGRFLDRLEGRFIQLLEGPEIAVLEMYGRIVADSRHSSILLLESGSLTSRSFAEWSMGFRSTNEHNTSLLGFLQLDDTFAANSSLPRPAGLLDYFRSFYEINKIDGLARLAG
jgi:hypothetical protein